jgi:hypothetical protein
MKSLAHVNVALAKVVGEVLFLYGLLGWMYGVIIQITNPEWLPLPLSHLTGSLRTDTFTIICLILRAVRFFTWRLTIELTKFAKNSSQS